MALNVDHSLIGWLVRHAAWLINRYQVRASGRTPYQHMRQREYQGKVLPFGEVVLYRDPSSEHEKFKRRWFPGVFVGKVDNTDELLL